MCKEKGKIKGYKTDKWICDCGNEPHTDGFYPCNYEGDQIEPDKNWTNLFVCDRCDAIIFGDGTIIKPGCTKDFVRQAITDGTHYASKKILDKLSIQQGDISPDHLLKIRILEDQLADVVCEWLNIETKQKKGI